ncbi:MAG TPA: GNAT family N-acetyltransferase [Anaerolineales bacterium]|nr:GNAT family N-acetyltransferase [Anaerolineales bacterium]
MRNITNRIYKREDDIQIIIDLLTKHRHPDHRTDYPLKVDIEENMASETVRANMRIWFDNGQPIGWAYVDDFRNLRWEFDTQYDALIGKDIVAWGESCIQQLNEKSITLDASCRENYAEKVSFLKRHGFHQTEGTSIAMVRDLSKSIPDPEPPNGFIIRPIAGVQEAEAVASTHRAAFGTEYMTIERRLAIMNSSEYDPSLDLLVIAPDGTVAAYCSCAVNEETKAGDTDPVATHPNNQRMGLARTLILTGMKLLKERGMISAHLGMSGDNIAMQKTAESVGFTIEYTNLWFSKEVT